MANKTTISSIGLKFHQIIAMIVKELLVLWKDREALALLFIMPLFFILVMSLALEGVYGAGTRERPIEILVINADQGELAEKVLVDLRQIEGLVLVEKINRQRVTRDLAEQLIAQEEFPLALVFKESFSNRIRSAPIHPDPTNTPVDLICDPVLNTQLLASVKSMLRGVIERRLYAERLPHQLKEEIARWKDQAPAGQREQFDFMSQRLNEIMQIGAIDGPKETLPVIRTVLPAGFEKARRPTAIEQNVPAYTIFGVFFIVLTLASGFLKEKADGTFQRLLISPMSRSVIMIGKLLPYYFVNLIQIALMFLVGVVIFDLQLGSLPALAFVSAALAASANGLGLMVAAFGRTEAQVNGFSVLLAVTLSALGGMLVPAYIMPDTMQTLSLLTPHAWALSGYHDIIIRGLGIREVLPEIGVLLGFALCFFILALGRFRFDG